MECKGKERRENVQGFSEKARRKEITRNTEAQMCEWGQTGWGVYGRFSGPVADPREHSDDPLVYGDTEFCCFRIDVTHSLQKCSLHELSRTTGQFMNSAAHTSAQLVKWVISKKGCKIYKINKQVNRNKLKMTTMNGAIFQKWLLRK